MKGFLGYPRESGPAGVRNYVVVVAAEFSCNAWARRIAAEAGVRGAGCCAVTHKHGLADLGADRAVFLRIMQGVLSHPNVAGGLVVVSGDEQCEPARLVEWGLAHGRPTRMIALEDFESTAKMLAAGMKMARELVRGAARVRREEVGLGQLRIGLKCAGTDRFSATTSNVVCGAAVDELIGGGATAMLTETPEMIGLGEEWLGRAASAGVRRRLRAAIAGQERRLSAGGGDLSGNELCAFNAAGGLGSLAEKSAIAVLKGGTGRIAEVVEYGAAPTRAGLVVMDGPAMTDLVISGFLGAGAQVMINCCGAGPANRMPFVVGADAAPALMPVIKLTGGAEHFVRKENRIDFNADTRAAGRTAARLGGRLVEKVLGVASGAATRTEEPARVVAAKGMFVHLPTRFGQA